MPTYLGDTPSYISNPPDLEPINIDLSNSDQGGRIEVLSNSETSSPERKPDPQSKSTKSNLFNRISWEEEEARGIQDLIISKGRGPN